MLRRNKDYVMIGGKTYVNPIKAIAAVWREVWNMDSTIGNMLCDIEDLQREVNALKKTKKGKK